MLRVLNEKHFHKVLKKVEECDMQAEARLGPDGPFVLPLLEQELKYLHNYGGDVKAWEVLLDWDFADWSFSVNWLRDGERVFNGGLIFHSGAGFNDGSLSVELNPPKGLHWSIHT